MARKPTTHTITIEMRPPERDRVTAIQEMAPLATRHAIVRAAFVLGLRALGQAQPEAVERLLLSLRAQTAA